MLGKEMLNFQQSPRLSYPFPQHLQDLATGRIIQSFEYRVHEYSLPLYFDKYLNIKLSPNQTTPVSQFWYKRLGGWLCGKPGLDAVKPV